MTALRFTRRAAHDLFGIGEYSLHTWGERQADRYLGELEICCQKLAATPMMGRPCENVLSGMRRFEYREHVVFFRQERDGIVVTRILHQRMLPNRHLLADQDDG